jgi:hypothetical protein
MKKIILFLTTIIIITSCSSSDKPKSTASLQSTVKVSDDVFFKKLNDTITISIGSYKECATSINITPDTLNHKTDNCVISCRTKAGGSCMLKGSKFSVEFHNISGVRVGTVQWHEALAGNWKLHESIGYNGYVVTCKVFDDKLRNNRFEITIDPDYTIINKIN